MKRPKYRLQVRLVAVRNPNAIVDGQFIDESHTLLDLRLDSLAHWASLIPIPALSKPRPRRKRVGLDTR